MKNRPYPGVEFEEPEETEEVTTVDLTEIHDILRSWGWIHGERICKCSHPKKLLDDKDEVQSS